MDHNPPRLRMLLLRPPGPNKKVFIHKLWFTLQNLFTSTAHHGAEFSESSVVHFVYSTPLYLKGNTHFWQLMVRHSSLSVSTLALVSWNEVLLVVGGSWVLVAEQMSWLHSSPRHLQPWPLGIPEIKCNQCIYSDKGFYLVEFWSTYGMSDPVHNWYYGKVAQHRT